MVCSGWDAHKYIIKDFNFGISSEVSCISLWIKSNVIDTDKGFVLDMLQDVADSSPRGTSYVAINAY